ncbi:MAG: hypothetical protein ABEH64_10185 [Salinirussus sp.]
MSEQQQLEISFQPGLTDQFPRYRDVIRAAVYGCGRPFKVVAADLDLSESMLSRMMSDNEDGERKRNFPVERLPELVQATGDKRPVYWLIEAFLEDEETRQKRALSTIESLLPELQQALKHAKGE